MPVKLLFYSYAFPPAIGGVEHIGHCIASGLAERGCQVTVITETACAAEEPEALFKVVRQPDRVTLAELVRECDSVHSNGASLRLYPLAVRYGKPFSWTHHGYQLQCIDGAGWVNGAPAPISPCPSTLHHLRAFGLRAAVVGGFKLWVRRWVGQRVAANVATSQHQAARQPLPRQKIIYNPIPATFAAPGLEEALARVAQADCTFTFVGRLVTEKGVDDLLHALAAVNESEKRECGKVISTLKIIGEGPELQSLKDLAESLGVASQVIWKTGLFSKYVDTAGICVIPSAWEEPGAVTVLELLAAGKPLIVSERGWLSECAGPACLTFPNRDRGKLAESMLALSGNEQLKQKLVSEALRRFALYEPGKQIQAYLDLFCELARKHSVSGANV